MQCEVELLCVVHLQRLVLELDFPLNSCDAFKSGASISAIGNAVRIEQAGVFK